MAARTMADMYVEKIEEGCHNLLDQEKVGAIEPRCALAIAARIASELSDGDVSRLPGLPQMLASYMRCPNDGKDYELKDVELAAPRRKTDKEHWKEYWLKQGKEAARFILSVFDDDDPRFPLLRELELHQRLQDGKRDSVVSKDVGIPPGPRAPGVAVYVCALCGVVGVPSTNHKKLPLHIARFEQYKRQQRVRKVMSELLTRGPEYKEKPFVQELVKKGFVPSEYSSVLRRATTASGAGSDASAPDAAAVGSVHSSDLSDSEDEAAPGPASVPSAPAAAAVGSVHSSDLSDSDSEADRSLPGTRARAAPGTPLPTPTRPRVSRMWQQHGGDPSDHSDSVLNFRLGPEAQVHDEVDSLGDAVPAGAMELRDTQFDATDVNNAVFATVPRSAAGDDDMRTHASSPKKQSDFE